MSNVGIDVAKKHLDIAVRPSGERFRVDNKEEGFIELLKRLKKVRPERILLEPSGGYELEVVHSLARAKLPVVVVNARQIRQFAQATGRLAKTDEIDADVLAHFAEAIQPEIRPGLRFTPRTGGSRNTSATTHRDARGRTKTASDRPKVHSL